jgi:hypothetical protein
MRVMPVRSMLFVAVLLAVVALPAPAWAGRLLVTGHDADLHCAGAGPQCHFVQIAVGYVRAGAPDPAKPVLILDKGSLQVGNALDSAFPPAGSVPRRVVDPQSAEFASLPLSTADFSAIIVASDATCGGCDLNGSGTTADSNAINARKADIEAFFNTGGGILAFSGASHGGNDADKSDDVYYGFAPIPVGGVAVASPFTLTADGRALGFTDGTGGTTDDINCCATHNSFTLPPAGSVLKVAETDSMGSAETLFAEGRISGGGFVPPAPPPPPPPPKPLVPRLVPADVFRFPSTRKCVSRRNFVIRLVRRANVRYVAAQVKVNGRPTRVFIKRERYLTIKGKVLQQRRIAARVDMRGFPPGQFRTTIQVIVAGSFQRVTGTRRYRTCARRGTGRRPGL